MPQHHPVFNSAGAISPNGTSVVRNAVLTLKVVAVTGAPVASPGRPITSRADVRPRRLAMVQNSACEAATAKPAGFGCAEKVTARNRHPDSRPGPWYARNQVRPEMTFTDS